MKNMKFKIQNRILRSIEQLSLRFYNAAMTSPCIFWMYEPNVPAELYENRSNKK